MPELVYKVKNFRSTLILGVTALSPYVRQMVVSVRVVLVQACHKVHRLIPTGNRLAELIQVAAARVRIG